MIPNSMWTAGCCVWNNGLNYESIAVMGNNVPDKDNTNTQPLKLNVLETILAGGNPNVVDLFPGSNGQCRN